MDDGDTFTGHAACCLVAVRHQPCTVATAQESQAEIAKKLCNPIADLISVPFQLNYDYDLGPTEKGERYLLNIQPVIPIHINAIARELNERPRKTLEYETPAARFNACVASTS